MSDVRDFAFMMVFDKETNDFRFIIDCKVKGETETIFLDTQTAWIEYVKEKVAGGEDVETILDHFFTGWWKEVIEDGIKAEWNRKRYTFDARSYFIAGTQYSCALRALAYGVVRDESLPIKPDMKGV